MKHLTSTLIATAATLAFMATPSFAQSYGSDSKQPATQAQKADAMKQDAMKAEKMKAAKMEAEKKKAEAAKAEKMKAEALKKKKKRRSYGS